LFPDYDDFFRLVARVGDDQTPAQRMTDALKFFLGESKYIREVLVTILQALGVLDPEGGPVPGASEWTTANPRGTQVSTWEFEIPG